MKRKTIFLFLILTSVSLLLMGCTAYTRNGGYRRGNYGAYNENVNPQYSVSEIGDEELTDDEFTLEESAAPVTKAENEKTSYGSSAALSDYDLTIAEMLTFAVQDEFLAHAEYVYIIDAYGSARPFANIVKAEENHINQLVPLFSANSIALPEDTGRDHVVPASNLTAAYQAGEAAEINNIAMYDAF